MIAVLVFNVLIILLALGIATQVVPTKPFSEMLDILHNSIGISTPHPNQVRIVLLIWLGFTIIAIDGMLYLLIYVFLKSK